MDIKNFPFKIEEIKEPMYIRNYDYKVALVNSQNERIVAYPAGHKTRITHLEGVYKATKVYKVTLTPDDVDTLKSISPSSAYFDLQDIAEAYCKQGIITDSRTDTILLKFHKLPMEFRMATIDSFVKCELNKKERELKKKAEEKQANLKLVELTLKTNLFNVLKENGIKVKASGNSIIAESVVDYNKLIDNALNYYLNDIVKELGCTINIKHVDRPTIHERDGSDTIFCLSDINLNLEQHINNQTKGVKDASNNR